MEKTTNLTEHTVKKLRGYQCSGNTVVCRRWRLLFLVFFLPLLFHLPQFFFCIREQA